ncbi:MAG: hypothetical protein ACE5ES_04015 [Candidatus Nanoarchaeia archaeon]
MILIRRDKKAQAWSLDLVVASLIFLVGIITLYIYAVNFSSQSQEQLNELFYEGNLASELILSDEDLGILTDGKVNQTKLDDFYGLSYQEQRNLLGVKNDFYFNITGLESPSGTPISYVGNPPSVGSGSENLIQITRLTIYKNRPVKINFFAWN